MSTGFVLAADLGTLVPQTSGGLVDVVATLLDELASSEPDLRLVVYASPESAGLVDPSRPNVEIISFEREGFYERLGPALAARRPDVLFRAYPTRETLVFPAERQIVMVPDLLHEERPQDFDPSVLRDRRDAFRRSLAGVGAIATLSGFAAEQIARQPEWSSDVVVVYPALPQDVGDACSMNADPAERALVPPGPFFLYPANLWPHKNHARLIEALVRARESGACQEELVLVGAPGSADNPFPERGEGSVRHLGYVSPALLRLLYERATALTFFSLHEGFGLPVLEAFALGTPVVCSNRGSLPEVAGDAALTCDPNDIEAIADLLREISSNSGLRRFLAERGRERLDNFSWRISGAKLRQTVERVAARASGSDAPTLRR